VGKGMLVVIVHQIAKVNGVSLKPGDRQVKRTYPNETIGEYEDTVERQRQSNTSVKKVIAQDQSK
jgi:hypothetical protein